MGLFDTVAEKAAQKIADQAQPSQKPTGTPSTNVAGQVLGLPESGVAPSDKSLAVGKKLEPVSTPSTNAAGQVLAQGETNVAPSDPSLAIGKRLELNPMPNTNPAQRVQGLGETDVSPGGPSAVAPIQPPPVDAQKVQAAVAAKQLPTVGQNLADKAVKNPDPSTPVSNPIEKASEEPNFWQKLMSVASNTGQSIFNLLGDFAMGYAGHPELAPSFQRIQREQALRLQGNQMQLQRDLLSMQQGFDKQQNDLNRELQMKLATAAGNPLEAQRIQNDYVLRQQELQNQRMQIMQSYQLQYLTRNLDIQSKVGAGGSAGALMNQMKAGQGTP